VRVARANLDEGVAGGGGSFPQQIEVPSLLDAAGVQGAGADLGEGARGGCGLPGAIGAPAGQDAPVFTPQVCRAPALSCVKTPLGGTAWPWPLAPQQAALPSVRTAQE
jgi:hypothetical protein